MLLALLRDPDVAVRVSACDGLLKLVDDVNFFAQHFEVHLVETVSVYICFVKVTV